MANTDLLNCPEQLQKLANCLPNVCIISNMVEAQKEFFEQMEFMLKENKRSQKKQPKEVKTSITKTYDFTDTEIEEILFNYLGTSKTFDDRCVFDVGQSFTGATITIKREENHEISSLNKVVFKA